MSGKDLVKLLKKNGWEVDHITGSHCIMKNGNKTLSVPIHSNKDLPKGTLNAIMKQGGIK